MQIQNPGVVCCAGAIPFHGPCFSLPPKQLPPPIFVSKVRILACFCLFPDVRLHASLVSSGSDEEAEEATRDAAATGGDSVGSASAVQATTSASPSSAGAAEASRAASSDPKASKESPKTPENEQTAGNEAARDEGKHRRSASSGDGFRARPKSTWQVSSPASFASISGYKKLRLVGGAVDGFDYIGEGYECIGSSAYLHAF